MILFFCIFLLQSYVYANAPECKPVQLIMTRAVGDSAKYNLTTKQWDLKNALTNVNLASLGGTFKYIISETIDSKTAYTGECLRKNNVSYIQFYQFTICNPNSAFNFFDNDAAANVTFYGDFGSFIAFDAGACHADDPYCGALEGSTPGLPKLGPYVGWQNQSADPRNPTDGSYWYSTVGQCPHLPWANKTAECSANFPGGMCAPGKTPDGISCTFNYKMLGQIALDQVVGITDIINPVTKKNFTSAQEFCKAKGVEFLRDPVTYDYVAGLPFWKDPLDPQMNAARIRTLLQVYANDPRNTPVPTPAALAKLNPDCGATAPDCVENGKIVCTRDDQMMCIKCSDITVKYPWDTCGKSAGVTVRNTTKTTIHNNAAATTQTMYSVMFTLFAVINYWKF